GLERLLGGGELSRVEEMAAEPHVGLDSQSPVVEALRELERALEVLDRALRLPLEPGSEVRGLEGRAHLQPAVADFGDDLLRLREPRPRLLRPALPLVEIREREQGGR